MFEVLHSGVFATVQDSGRNGYMDRGVTPSGALDMEAYRYALLLLGKEKGNAVEAMAGFKLRVLEDCVVSITGADLDARINGLKTAIWRTIALNRGDILSFEKRISGMRVYISVAGGFDAERLFGSTSTTLREGVGKRLQRGDILRCRRRQKVQLHTRRLKHVFLPDYAYEPLLLHLLPTYQYDLFPEETKEILFTTDYTVSLQSNRMGYRLEGTPLKGIGKEIFSEGIAFGAVQVTGEGMPIVLLSERQTIGGYAKIGVVVAEDCYRLAQLSPGMRVRFVKIDLQKYCAKSLY